jgi:protein-arginine kinase activator protein McsA
MEKQTGIKKRYKELMDVQRKTDIEIIKNRCGCPHIVTDTGELTLKPVNMDNQTEGRRKYICKQCGKEISIQAIPETKAQDAIEVIDAMCDVIKMKSNYSNEDNKKVAAKVAKMQYRNQTLLMPAYKAACQQGDSRRHNGNRDNNNNNHYHGGMQRPISGRH